MEKILAIYIVCMYNKMENKERTKKEKRIEINLLRTAVHGVNFGHLPLRNITIKL